MDLSYQICSFQACPNRACFYKLRAVGLFLMLSESQKGEVWLTIILETQLSLEETFGRLGGRTVHKPWAGIKL